MRLQKYRTPVVSYKKTAWIGNLFLIKTRETLNTVLTETQETQPHPRNHIFVRHRTIFYFGVIPGLETEFNSSD